MRYGQLCGGLVFLLMVTPRGPTKKDAVRLSPPWIESVKTPRQQAPSSQSKWIGRLAPDFKVPLRDGATFQLHDELGSHIVVLEFFTTWCVPCRHEMPGLESYYATHKNSSDVMLVGIDVREKTQRVDDLISEFHISFPVGIDPGLVQQQYAVYEFPTTVVIGLDNRIRFYHAGEVTSLSAILSQIQKDTRPVA